MQPKPFKLISPENMRISAIVRTCLLLAVLIAGLIGIYFLSDTFSFWYFLIIPTYIAWVFKLSMGIYQRCVGIDNHVFKLVMNRDSRIAEVWVYKKWFETQKYLLDFDELTAVVHKSNKPRLRFRAPIIAQNFRKFGIGYVIERYFIRLPVYMFIFLVSFFFSGWINADDAMGDVPDHFWDARLTALSLVKGKNIASYILLPTYGWDSRDIESLFQECQQLKIRVFDKRSPREIADGVFL
ncbi:MAG: hypothetical protein AAF696_31855 [Bacteroidota bacterium]